MSTVLNQGESREVLRTITGEVLPYGVHRRVFTMRRSKGLAAAHLQLAEANIARAPAVAREAIDSVVKLDTPSVVSQATPSDRPNIEQTLENIERIHEVAKSA